MPDQNTNNPFNLILDKKKVSIPSLLSEEPLEQQSTFDQTLTGLWQGLYDTPTNAPLPAKIGAAISEVGPNPIGDAKNLLAVSLIPPKMAKQVGRQLVDKISAEAPGMAQIWERLYEAYPRLVGNVANVQMQPLAAIKGQKPEALQKGLDTAPADISGLELQQFYNDNDLNGLPRLANSRTLRNATIAIDPRHAANNSLKKNAHVAAHELTHQAQNLMTPNLSGKYNQQSDALGYHNNPYELGAERAGNRFAQRFEEAEKSGISMREARRAIRERGIPDEARQEPQDPWEWLMQKLGLRGAATNPMEQELIRRK
jgi:hypothetical protein